MKVPSCKFGTAGNERPELQSRDNGSGELVTVISEISSGSDKVLGGDGLTYVPIATDQSTPMYYFKKAKASK